MQIGKKARKNLDPYVNFRYIGRRMVGWASSLQNFMET